MASGNVVAKNLPTTRSVRARVPKTTAPARDTRVVSVAVRAGSR